MPGPKLIWLRGLLGVIYTVHGGAILLKIATDASEIVVRLGLPETLASGVGVLEALGGIGLLLGRYLLPAALFLTALSGLALLGHLFLLGTSPAFAVSMMLPSAYLAYDCYTQKHRSSDKRLSAEDNRAA